MLSAASRSMAPKLWQARMMAQSKPAAFRQVQFLNTPARSNTLPERPSETRQETRATREISRMEINDNKHSQYPQEFTSDSSQEQSLHCIIVIMNICKEWLNPFTDPSPSKKPASINKQDRINLPRFYSNEGKSNCKTIAVHTSGVHTTALKKRNAKTQKNESPFRPAPPSLKKMSVPAKKVSVVGEWQSQTRQELQKESSMRNYLKIYNSQTNSNIIKFKQKGREVSPNTSGNYKTTLPPRQITQQKLPDKPKHTTCSKQYPKQHPKEPIEPKEYRDYLEDPIPPSSSHDKLVRADTGFQSTKVLLETECSMLSRLSQLIYKMHRQPSNIEIYELFIVADKVKLERKIFGAKESHTNRLSIIVSRFVIYTITYCINSQIPLERTLKDMLPKIHSLYEEIIRFMRVNLKDYRIKAKSVTKDFSADKLNSALIQSLEHALRKSVLPMRELLCSMLTSAVARPCFDELLFIDKTLKWQLLGMPTSPFLPPTEKTHFLILDLDETLIHFSQQDETYHIRPFAEQFLISTSINFEITIFTAATKEYADQILNELDPHAKCISHRLYRNHLTYVQNEPIKDIALLGRELARTIIVDNLPANFQMHRENGVAIKSWFGTGKDEVLLKLNDLLQRMLVSHGQDLRLGLKAYEDEIKTCIM